MGRSVVIALALAASAALAAGADGLTSPDEETRFKAVQAYAAGGGKAVGPAMSAPLVELLREDPSPRVRRSAAFALGHLQPPQKLALAALVEVVADRDELAGVRGAAVDALASQGKGSKRVADALEAAAADPKLTRSAVRSLAAIGAPDRIPPFLEHRDEAIRTPALEAFLGSGIPEATVYVLEGKDKAARLKTLTGLMHRDYRRSPLTPRELAAVQRAVADADVKVQTVAIRSLKNAGHSSTIVPALVEALGSTDSELRWAALGGLSVAGPGVAPHLTRILADLDRTTDKNMRLLLVAALGEAGEGAKPALPALHARLKDPDVYTRRAAVAALEKAGVADRAEAIRHLKPCASDPDPDVRKSAAAAVSALSNTPDEVAAQLRNPDPATALLALPALPRLGDAAAALVPDLLALVARMPPPARGLPTQTFEVVKALVGIGGKAVPGVLEGFKSADPQVRQVCAQTLELVQLDAVEALPALRQGLAAADPDLRRACATALGNVGFRAREAVPDLLKAMAAHDDMTGAAGEALGWIGGVAGDDAKRLFDLARAPAPASLRSGRIRAAGGAGAAAKPVLDEIERGLDPKDRVLIGALAAARTYANPSATVETQMAALSGSRQPFAQAAVLLKLELTAAQKKTLVTALVAALDKGQPVYDVQTLRVLGWMGADAADALPAVERLKTSPDEVIRAGAKRAAGRIRP